MSYADLILRDRPVAYWPLQEAAGTATGAVDLTGHGHDLVTHYYSPYTAPASPHFTFGSAGPFTGQTALSSVQGIAYGLLVASNAAALPQQIGSYSWEAWVYYDEAANPTFGGADFMTQSPNATYFDDGVNAFLHLWDGSAGGGGDHYSIDMTVNGGDSLGHTDAGSISTNAWHHVVCTAQDVGSGSGVVALYIDGTLMHLSTAHPDAPADWGITQRFWLMRNAFEGATPNASIAHAALYDYPLSACQVQSHYDQATTGSYTACPEWVRLIHVSGRGDWGSDGEHIAEHTAGKLSRIHDGTTGTIYSDGLPALTTPLGVLTATPAVLVGKDPVTNLPSFCPPPVQPASGPVPTPPVVVPITPIPGGTDPCVQARCGAALAMAQHLQSLYQNWQTWINAAISAVGTASIGVILDWLATLLAGLAVAETIATSVVTVFNAIRPLLAAVSGVALGGVLPAWDTTTVDNVQRVFFGALQCTGGSVSITPGDMTNVAGYIRANTASFLGNIVSELLAASCDYSALSDWQAIVTAATPSNLCNGY